MAQIVWTEPALNALDEIADHIALDDHAAACRFVRKVFDKVDLLEKNPSLGNIPKDLRSTPYRRIVIKPAYVHYRVEDGKIIVILVERSERDFQFSRFSK